MCNKEKNPLSEPPQPIKCQRFGIGPAENEEKIQKINDFLSRVDPVAEWPPAVVPGVGALACPLIVIFYRDKKK